MCGHSFDHVQTRAHLLIPRSLTVGPKNTWTAASARRLRQVLLNGLSNAIKFTDGGGSIRIATRSTKDSVLIDITDTGKGIPADQLARMFEEFEQLDNSRSRRGEGTGIGLPLSKALVEMMGGRLTLTSREGIGTTFRVRLTMASKSPVASSTGAAPELLIAVSREVAGVAHASAP